MNVTYDLGFLLSTVISSDLEFTKMTMQVLEDRGGEGSMESTREIMKQLDDTDRPLIDMLCI